MDTQTNSVTLPASAQEDGNSNTVGVSASVRRADNGPQEQPSAEYVDDDPYRTFTPPSRFPTEEDDLGGAPFASSLATPGPILHGRIARVSTADDVGRVPPNFLQGPPSGNEKLSRSASDHIRPRRMPKRVRDGGDIADSISKAMGKRNGIGLDGTKQYIPDQVLSSLITDDSIRETLMDTSLIGFTKENKKLFTITVLVFGDHRSRLRAIKSFHTHGFSDRNLPVDELTANGTCHDYSQPLESSDGESEYEAIGSGDSQSDSMTACRHTPEADAFHYEPWTHAHFQTFYDKQWSFLIPKFNKHGVKYELHDRTVLPVRDVKMANHGDEGHFSVVYQAEMLAEYQDSITTNNETISVAIKELKQRTGPAYNVERDWQNEGEALSVFNKLGDDHIVKGIGAFKQRGKCYLVMEWADGGSLQQLWEKHPTPHPALSGHDVMQLLKQFRGLAHALFRMHHYHSLEDESITSPIAINAPENQADEASWRHGDLKPSNILLFKDPSHWVGTLKLGDLGRAREHKEGTGRRRFGTKEQFCTERYEPPEGWTRLSAPRSRLYDIWSFGCVILETVTWILKGTAGFKSSGSEPGHESPYWTYDVEKIHYRSAKIREVVSAQMQQMLDDLPKPSALRDLVRLVKEKLLIVTVSSDADVFTPGERANSLTLRNELDNIISKATADSSYLFTGSGRTGTRPPLPDQLAPKMDFLSPDRPIGPGNFVARRTSLPLIGRPNDGVEGKNDSYIHDFDDTWKLEEDNVFARQILNRGDVAIQPLLPAKSSLLCDACKHLDFTAPGLNIKDTLTALYVRMREGCEFCAMRLRVAKNSQSGEAVEFDRVSSGLRISNANQGSHVLSLCRTSGVVDERLDKGPAYVQIGLLKLPEAGSADHFGILRAWLKDCDDNHQTCHQAHTATANPTRLIDLGLPESPTLRLIESVHLPESEKASMQYIALSHPWGDPTSHQHLCTTRANVERYKVRIDDPFPETLADAVKIARGIGVRYLWIDSLCIIQGDDGDFAQEADRMETVYSSAYCVIAATNATGSSSGFLKRDPRRDVNRNIEQDIVSLPYRSRNGDLKGKIYVRPSLDDFEKDVRQSALNQRGWVFQERALSRRTIHFANKQTYWECGEGIRCETLTKMRNTYEMFLGDPNFPSYGLRHRKGGDIAFYEFLYEQYSYMSFSRREDRPVAIGGLEQRLIRALEEKGRSGLGNFGVFDEYWGRGLLWKRASDVPKMTRLTSGARGGSPAPSWSWMGHTGGITFMKHEPHSVEWLADEVTLPWSNLKGPRTSTTSYRGELGLRGFARDFRFPKNEEVAAGKMDIVYEDEARREGRTLKCLIIGRLNMGNRSMKQVRNYVLVLAQKTSPGRDDVYERLGAGSLHGSLIEFNKSPLSVWIE